MASACLHLNWDTVFQIVIPVNPTISQDFWGALAIDEAIQLCASVSTGNNRTLCWFQLPQWHSSTQKETVVKNRRLLEDKILASLESAQIRFIFWFCASAMSPIYQFVTQSPIATCRLGWRALDSYEVALNFADSAHQGDRRKKSQQWSLGPKISCFGIGSNNSELIIWWDWLLF